MRRRRVCVSLCTLAAAPRVQALGGEGLRKALGIASSYTAPAAPHYVAALLVSAQRRLAARANAPELARSADAATAALRSAVSAPGFRPPNDWPRLAGYAALAEAATHVGDAAAGPLAVQALRSVLADGSAGPFLVALRPWTDDMFMATLLTARTLPLLPAAERADAAQALGAALLALTATLQRPDGLFNHAEGSPVAWGRGNGFASLALAQALTGPLSPTSPVGTQLLARLQAHLHSLLMLQSTDGSWRQVLDHAPSAGELTVTAMSLSALATARARGWLPAGPTDAAIAQAWSAVHSRVDAHGGFSDVCASTPAGPTLDFYLRRPIVSGRDDRAAAMVLQAAASCA